MKNKLLFSLSALGVVAACVAAVLFSQRKPPLPPAFDPAADPYAEGIYAEGIVESAQASGQNVSVYPELPGTVKAVLVAEGQAVHAGTPLIQLDDSIPRAQVELARANYKTARDTFEKYREVFVREPGAIAKDTLDTAANAAASAQANLALQDATLAKYTLSAPRDGVVLTVNASPGDYLSTQGSYSPYTGGNTPAATLGSPSATMNVRCYVDEILVPRLPPLNRISGQMSVRGSTAKIPLEFVRVQPFVSPKIQLSNQQQERVDVRVLPLVFRIGKHEGARLYPGQLVDVFIGQDSATVAAKTH